MPEITFVVPIIRHDFLLGCLKSLYEYTPVDFNVIVIDQTPDGIKLEDYPRIHLLIRPYRNLGFSKAMNTGILLSNTPYIMLLNDDVEFLDKRWWQGILDTFATDGKIIAVNPMSPKEGSWGYGYRVENSDSWQPPESFVTDETKLAVYPKMPDGTGMMTADAARQGYDFLIEHHPRWSPNTTCDAIAMWATVFKKEGLEKFGLLDEQFYPGGGEDYDYDCRVYSQGYRMVGSTKSWVWHHWGSSKDKISERDPTNKLFESRPRWNNNEELWGPEFDVWGKDKSGQPLKRKKEIFIDSL